MPQLTQIPQPKWHSHNPPDIAPERAAVKQIIIGHIGGIYGVHGWIRIYSYTRPIENIFQYIPWQIENSAGDLMTLESCIRHHQRQQGFIVETSFKNPEEAGAWKGSKISAFRRQLPTLENNRYYWVDLIGLEVFNLQQDYLGQISDLYETAAHDVLVVKSEQSILIPFVRDCYIKSVQLAEGRLTVDWPLQED